MDAKMRAETIVSLAKAMRVVYVFFDVGDAVAKMLEERDARGEYNAVTSAKAFNNLLTTQMREVAHDKHLSLAYTSGVLPPLPVPEREKHHLPRAPNANCVRHAIPTTGSRG